MEDILIPIGICVVLPVMIVWLVNRTRQNETNRMTDIMLKAIETGATVDLEFFKNQLNQKQKGSKTIKERLLKYLLGGCLTILLGVVMMVVTYILVRVQHGLEEEGLLFILGSGVLFSIGISLIVAYIVGMKTLAKEIEAETKSLEQK